MGNGTLEDYEHGVQGAAVLIMYLKGDVTHGKLDLRQTCAGGGGPSLSACGADVSTSSRGLEVGHCKVLEVPVHSMCKVLQGTGSVHVHVSGQGGDLHVRQSAQKWCCQRRTGQASKNLRGAFCTWPSASSV